MFAAFYCHQVLNVHVRIARKSIIYETYAARDDSFADLLTIFGIIWQVLWYLQKKYE